MIDQGASVDVEEFHPGDPYDVDLPDAWSAQYRDRTAVYENDRGDHRVRIVEFSRGLSLYWWVDVYVGGEEWRRREVGLGDSYTDPDAAAAAAESYLDSVAGGAGPRAQETDDRAADAATEADPKAAVASGRRAPGSDGWRADDARSVADAADPATGGSGSAADTDATE